MFVSVCNSLYLSICLYLFICSFLCTSLRSSSQGSNSQQQSATVHKQSSSHGSHGCLFISVYTFISVHICLYQTFICAYMHIFVHICIYLFISAYICAYLCTYVYIQKLHFDEKKTKFLEKKIFGFKSVLKTGWPVRSSKIKNSHVCTRNRSRDLPVPCNSPNHSANAAVHFYI